MSFQEKITLLFEEELHDRVNSIITEYAETISKKHGIPLEQVLKYIPENYTSNICRGTKSNGHRCTFRASRDGYCRHHETQAERLTKRSFSTSNLHNHGPEQMFVRGCPGCESSNGLIDLGV